MAGVEDGRRGGWGIGRHATGLVKAMSVVGIQTDVSDVSLLIEGDFIGQAEVAVALPVVEEYIAEAVMPGGVIERVPGGASLIRKGGCSFDGFDGKVLAIPGNGSRLTTSKSF